MPCLDLSTIKTPKDEDECPTLENRYGLDHNDNHPSVLHEMPWDSDYKIEKFILG